MRHLVILFIFIHNLSFCQNFESCQFISCDDKEIKDAYNLAINTVEINVRRGILAAGGDYGGEWTRDIAINSWNAVSLLYPNIAENSLWSVTINKDSVGHQYWDKIIWVISAYNHYKATGKIDFLKQAYRCSANTMKQMEQSVYDTLYGLFKGPSVFNDGIAGYPIPIYDTLVQSSSVFDHPNTYKIKCLSTNCIYYGAYLSLIEMARILEIDTSTITSYQAKANNLKNNIIKHLYDPSQNSFYYLTDQLGNKIKYQEGLGISFAIIFGIIENNQAKKIINNLYISNYGITSIWPNFNYFSDEKPGRHNNLIWPMVNGFFAQACIKAGNYNAFLHEFKSLTHLAIDPDKGDYNFREIYDPITGKPEGGWQCGIHWTSCKYQTWSATAYLNMVLYGLVGIRLENNKIFFQPYLPSSIGQISINNIKYQEAELSITIKGSGTKIKKFILNGKKQSIPVLSKNLKGSNRIVIEMQ